MRNRITTLICSSFLCLAGAGPVLAAETQEVEQTLATEANENTRELVQKSAEAIEKLTNDSEAREVLNQARAVFIVPDYGRAALGVGGAGGQGLLVAKNEGSWSAPAFYNIGAINVGVQAGIEAGEIAFLIMSEPAMEGFRDEHNFSLNADAGLTIVDFSARGQASAGKGEDVIVWADTEGLFADLAVSVSDIFWDEEANQAYYNQSVALTDIIDGNVQDPMADSELRSEFAAMEEGGMKQEEMMRKDDGMMHKDKETEGGAKTRTPADMYN
ncbi:MAG: lipid-binding SYLF domain-containing protein [Thiogranum sp.]|nr:lipid-binding SYLF domain-containing protein [Thiogranum sp.]